MRDENGGVRVPFMTLVAAVITALLMISGWNLRLEATKADKVEVSAQLDRLDHKLDKIRDLLISHMEK